MNELKGKKILFVGVGYYDYDNRIKVGFEQMGALVTYFCSVKSGWRIKILQWFKLYRKVERIREQYITTTVLRLPTDFDLVFIVKCECFQRSNFELFKERFGNIRTVVYFWDAYEMHKNILLIREFYSGKIVSFDRKDANEHHLYFHPLFYSHKIPSKQKFKYDISFVGSSHSDRYEIVSKMREELEKRGYSYKFLLITGHIDYWKRRYINHTIDAKDADLFVLKPISYKEFLKITENSNVILDIQHPCQSGLTMRTIETIGGGKKLLTTNNHIQCYCEIPSQMYSILNRDVSNVDWNFITNKDPINNDMEYFSLKEFIHAIYNYAN